MELLVIIAGLLALRWFWHAWLHPFTPCGRCGGSGKNGGSTGRRWGRCWRCHGKGHRQVIGSRTVHKILKRKESG